MICRIATLTLGKYALNILRCGSRRLFLYRCQSQLPLPSMMLLVAGHPS